jgi:D-alanyl-D-alanine carboxypeptidase (penicillin-binding protein 5/6)
VLDEIVTFSRRADQTKGSTCGIRAGESLSVRELLYGLLLPSGNDASVALGEHFGKRLMGEVPDQDPYRSFVEAMNVAAKELGLDKTRFVNTHGMSEPGHHSSAGDLLKLSWQALQDPAFAEYVATSQHGCTVDGPGGYRRNVIWRNTNRLLNIAGYDGVKTGTTSAAGACLVSRSQRGERSLMLVVLGSAASDSRYADTRNLSRWAWNQLPANEVELAEPATGR